MGEEITVDKICMWLIQLSMIATTPPNVANGKGGDSNEIGGPSKATSAPLPRLSPAALNKTMNNFKRISRRVQKNIPSWGGDVRLVGATLLLLSCQQSNDHIPLYEDGWQIWSAHSGAEITDAWLQTVDRANEHGFSIPKVLGLEYLSESPLDFYGFAVITNGHRLIWDEDSEITVYYLVDDDTLSASSIEIFFCQEQIMSTMKLPGQPLYGPITVPNKNLRIFGTQNGNPVVFARFLWGREPDSLLKCTVANVHSIERGQ